MSTQPLDKKLRKQLENTIIKARNVAEAGARTALERLCVGDGKPGEHLTEAMRQQRNKLRAHGRQIGDSRKDSAEQTIEHLVQETAYEQWHRMLFARFLAENSLLIYEDGVTPLSIQDCFELAEDEDGVNGWELAGRYASAMLPQIFRTENPVLTIRFSPEHQRELEKLLEGLETETFQASDSLGWVYQYWQTQKKDEVNKSGNKIGADELSAVTQLFTEPYMVSFLLDNSLGAWWVSHYPQYKDLLPFQYLRYAPEQLDDEHTEYKETAIPAAGTFEEWPKALSELKMLDPCCGSGHFLVATLLMLVPMRMKAESLTADKAIERVLTENIHGLELDQRCVEIAAFAVALEAWRYPDSSGYRPLPSLNIAWVGQSIKAKKEDWLSLAGDDEHLYYGMEALYNTFKDAPLLGSLIDPGKSIAKNLLSDGFYDLHPLLNKALQQFEVVENQEAAIAAKGMALAASLLSKKYTIVATNVPYRSSNDLSPKLNEFFKTSYIDASTAIETVFLLRCLRFCENGNTTCLVLPQDWLFKTSYKDMRIDLLKDQQWHFIAMLGPKAFQTPMWDFNIQLLIMSKGDINRKPNHLIRGVNVSGYRKVEEKSQKLIVEPLQSVQQKLQLTNPDSRIILDNITSGALLKKYAKSVQGIKTGDDGRVRRNFWEVGFVNKEWTFYQSTISKTTFFGGLIYIVYWGDEGSGLARRQGNSVWGKKGLAISQMASLPGAMYLGEKYDSNMTAIVPLKDEYFEPLFAYGLSGALATEVRKIDSSLKPTNGSFEKIPFDIEHWTKVAQEKYPNGLPKPYSDDPTQWIFHGHPAPAEAPLQVAVARLLGYQWPAESDKEMELSEQAREWIAKCESLSSYIDDDGIVCLSPVRGEKSADERLEALLMAAFGEHWNASLRNKLLSEVNCKGKSLGFWLREKFFEQHCKLFQDRPFIWHIWDGLADGFSALVNYHQLNRQNLERLIYTYLGDWIRTQDHGVKEGIDGALLRLQAAQILKTHLETILDGEAPYDIFVRWKSLAEQPLGWNPDINDGVRMNIRPFMAVPDVGKKEAGILRTKPNIKWTKDRGNDVASAPWYKLGLQYGESEGSRINDHHLSLAEKQAAKRCLKKSNH
jgi:hypothetical protein